MSPTRTDARELPSVPTPLDAIAIGGSAGAFSVLGELLRALPAVPPPVLVVLHLADDSPSVLHEILSLRVRRAVKQAEDKERPTPGCVYVAPPGYHLLVEGDGSLALSCDEPVHFSRPSIDVLFESAAEAYRSRLAAALLSGASRDGASGLAAVQRCGGTAIVQQPETAEAPLMPSAAIEACSECWVLSPRRISDWLRRLDAGAGHRRLP